MFTGLVEDVGTVVSIEAVANGRTLTIRSPHIVNGASIGDSIAVDGCCLTVTGIDGDTWTTMAMVETINLTAIGDIEADDPVNLEPAMTATDRIGGHLVQGHIDTVVDVVDVTPEPDGSIRVRFELPAEIERYVVHKGSIALDGVSLTVAAIGPDWFEVALIPHTQAVTTLGALIIGSSVNVELDVMAKQLEALVAPYLDRMVRERIALLAPSLAALKELDA